MSMLSERAYRESFDLARVAEAAAQYERDGFVIAAPVLSSDLIRRTRVAMDEVMAGRYETGVAPRDAWWKPGDEKLGKLRKIDQPHLANRTIREAIGSPAMGEWLARLLDAKMLQVWAVQLLHKPATGGSGAASVGWHQDYQYWSDMWTPDSEVFTVWIALSDVDEPSGPVCFAAGSNHWGFQNKGSFFAEIDKSGKEDVAIPEGENWVEVGATMPAGAFSVHHKLTFHASYPNVSDRPRLSFAVHMRTERSTPTPGNSTGYDYVGFLDDDETCPVIYGSRHAA